MKRYLLIALPLLVLSCSLWPYAAMQAPAMQTEPAISVGIETPSPTPQSVTVTKVCTVTATALNVRSGPGIHYPVLSWVRFGDVVEILDTSGAWLETDAGWIHGSYCR